MKKILYAMVFLGLTISVSAAPLLVEGYQEGTINFPSTQQELLTVVELSFSVDTACYVLFATGGFASLARIWLDLDGDSLPPALLVHAAGNDGPMPITYSYLITKGSHTVSLMLTNYPNSGNPTLCEKAYLQALIFLPDTPPAVTEQPDVEPGMQTSAVISQGPYVSAPGASELVDSSGRVIENAIADGKVRISTLSPGTYFARSGERTVVKIVKVD